ncbi:MAG: COG1361 S-layer family protein [Nitrososphaeria archaeon]
MRSKALASTALILLFSSVLANVGTATASSFDVTSVTWGTPAAPIEVGPGDRNVPLTVTLQYIGWYTASNLKATLNLPSGFTDLDGYTYAKAYATGIVPNSFFQLTFSLNVGNNVPFSSSMFTLKLMWNTTWDTDLSQDLTFSVQVKGKVKLNFDALTVYLKPGKVNDVTIRVNNRGTGNASEITTYVTGPSQVSLLNSLPTVPELNAGSSAQLKLRVYVSPQAATSPITLSISSTYLDGYLNLRGVSQSLGFITENLEQTTFDVRSSTDYLTINELNHINLTVDNQGPTAIKDLRIRFSPQPPLNLINSDGEISLGTLPPEQKTQFPITLYPPSTSSDSATLSLTITYTDESQTAKSEVRTLSFLLNKISELSPISIKVQPSTLVAGKENNLTIIISNIGTVLLRSVSVSYSFQGGQFTWLQPDISQINQLSPGQSFVVNARVFDPPTSIASTVLQANIKYYDAQNNLKQEARNIGLLSQGLIDLQMVDFSILPEKPLIGQVFSVTVTLTNIGTIVSSAVIATPHLPPGFKMFGSNSIFVGDMQVNTPTTFTLSILISETTNPGTYQVPVELTYFDNLRNQLSVIRNITVDVHEKSTSTQTSSIPLTPESGILSIATYLILGTVMLVLGLALGKRFSRK